MGAPSINILFKQAGATAIKRGNRGVVALLLKDTIPSTNPLVLNSVADIPTALSAANKEQLNLAFLGYLNPPKQVVAYFVNEASTDYTGAMHYLETVKWDYFAFPEIASEEIISISSWIKGLRDTVDKRVKAVLPNCVGDHEGIINYTNDENVQGSNTYTAQQYCARIAGLLAGTPLTISATYAPLSELKDCDHLTKAELDTAVDGGQLVLVNDGAKVKIVRAVNSLTTTSADKGYLFKKIKIVDISDQIHDDIKTTISDNYIGKVPNDYDHKVLLLSAISGYFDQLELDGLLDKGKSSVGIDVAAQEAYLKSIGVDTSLMNEQEIKEANTDDKVFIEAKIKILDAMEDVSLNIGI